MRIGLFVAFVALADCGPIRPNYKSHDAAAAAALALSSVEPAAEPTVDADATQQQTEASVEQVHTCLISSLLLPRTYGLIFVSFL